MVVERHRLARLDPVQPDAEVVEVRGALAAELADHAHLVVHPARIARVDDKPACGRRNAVLDPRFVHCISSRRRERGYGGT